MKLKHLKLHLPDEQAIKDSLVSTNTAKLKEELANLPYGNMVQALDQVIAKLALLNRTQIATNLRFEILQCFLPSFQMFFEHLTSREGSNQPTSFQQARERYTELCRELSFGYKLALLSFPENNRFKTKKLAERVYCAMAFSSLALLVEFQKHQTKTAPYWSDLHQLYTYARSKNMLENLVDFSALPNLANSVQGLYLQISITAISDPYQLLPEQILQTWSYLSHHSDYAKISELEPNTAPESGYVIKLHSDEKPQSHRWFSQAEDILALDLTPLNERLSEQILQLETNPEANISGLKGVPPEGRRALLAQLTENWSQTSQRSEERVSTSKAVDFAYSIRDVHYVVSHSSESIAQIHAKIADHIEGEITDESNSGACVSLKTAPTQRIEPGQLVLLYENNLGMIKAPKLAMVRWNTADTSTKKTHLGIKYLPGQVYPVSVKADDKITVDTYPRSGLLLQITSGQAHEWQVITTPGLYQEDRKLSMLFEGQANEQPALAKRLIVDSKDMQIFSIEIQDATNE